MKIITAIENKKINEQLNNIKNIEILNSDIQYKEGILEYLEKNNNLDLIILKENLPGQINLFNLINEIQKINNKTKIIILINNSFSDNYKKIKNTNYIYLEKITANNILKILNIEKENIKNNNKTNIIQILGNAGAGKTIFSAVLSKIISEIKNKKVLLIDEDENKILNKNFLKNNYKNIFNKKEIINFNNKIYLLNINYLINNKINILEYLNKIKNDFDYIIIDSKNNNSNKYEKIISKKIFLFEANLLELEKAKKYICKENTEIIINKKNINSIDKNIIEKTFNKKILFEINYDKKINLFINNNFDLNYLNKKLILKIIKKIIKIKGEISYGIKY